MESISLNHQIPKLKHQVESQLKWGESISWSNYDFEKLSEQIADKTGVSLSVSTLKRIFGKVNYTSEPSQTTLNALARFVNYADWRDFINHNPDHTERDEIVRKKPFSILKINYKALIIFGLAIITMAILGAYLLNKKSSYHSQDFKFSSKKMLIQGLPNSVIFDYDASKAREKDSVFICQTWDIRRKVLVNKNDKHHSAIYYYPGYFRAKLMIGREIIREHDIQIKTDGWLGLVEAEWGKEPIYFKKEDVLQGNTVLVNEAVLKKYNLNVLPEPPKIRFFNQKDIHHFKSDNFIFETELKSTFSSGANTCQKVEVLLQAKDDILIIPLVNKACIGDIFFAAFGYYVHSHSEDLSGFGCNVKEWTKLRVECKQGNMIVFINEKPCYEMKIKNAPAEIVGVQYRFNGLGEVKNTFLEANGKKIVF
jgi:hypothetical protein